MYTEKCKRGNSQDWYSSEDECASKLDTTFCPLTIVTLTSTYYSTKRDSTSSIFHQRSLGLI